MIIKIWSWRCIEKAQSFKFLLVEAADRNAIDSTGFRDTFPSRPKNQTSVKLKSTDNYE